MRTVFGLVFLVLFGTAAGGADETPTAEERKAIDALAKLGWQGSVDPNLHPDARVAVKLGPAVNANLTALKKYPTVGAVTVLDASKVNDAGYAALKDLPKLRKLSLNKPRATAPALAAIGACGQLRTLAVIDGGVGDADLAGLRKLTRLESLDLSQNPRVTDKGMAVVKGLERLEFLYLADTGITDKGLFELKPLDGLRTLHVGGTKVTADAAERFVDEMPNLRAVRR
jgi:hypothetical protein